MRELIKVAGTATPNHLTIMYANFLLKFIALLGKSHILIASKSKPDVFLDDELDHGALQLCHVDGDEGPRHQHRRVHQQDGQFLTPHRRDLNETLLCREIQTSISSLP